MKKTILAISIFLLGWAAPLPAEVITYQGRLKEASLPVNDNRLFLFEFCDDEFAGVCTPSPAGAQPFAVQNGLFKSTFTVPAVNLTLGQWYLKVSVAGTPLTPRERLTAVPYSVYASSSAYSSMSVQKTGDAMSGQLTIYGSTLTVTGNEFSVGGSTFVVKNGYVGIGTSSPANPLQVSAQGQYVFSANSATSFATMNLVPSGSGTARLNSNAGVASRVALSVGHVDHLVVHGSGNVGISSTTPVYRLVVSSGAGEAGNMVVISTGDSSVIRMTGAGQVYANSFYGDGSGLTGVAAATGVDVTKVAKAGDTMSGQLTLAASTLTVTGNAFSVGGSSLVVAAGRVGIGTDSPQAGLDVLASPAYSVALFRSTGVTSVSLQSDDTAVRRVSLGFNSWSLSQGGMRHMSDMNSEENGDLTIFTTNAGASSGIERLRITGGGRVGLTYGSPQARLDVLGDGSTSDDMVQIWRNSAGAIVSSVSATGQLQAFRFIGDGSGLTNVAATTGVDASKLPLAGGTMSGDINMAGNDIYSAGDVSATGDIGASRYFIGGSPVLVLPSGIGTLAVGPSAGEVSAGAYNLFVGSAAGKVNISGTNNTMLGYGAGADNTSGSGNTFIGSSAGANNLTGVQNIVIGFLQNTSASSSSSELNVGGVLFGRLGEKTIGISTRAPQAALDIVSTGTLSSQMAQIWRDSTGLVVGSMSVTGDMAALRYVGDGSGLTNVAATTGVDASKVSKAGDTMSGQLTLAGSTLTVTGGAVSVSALGTEMELLTNVGGGHVNTKTSQPLYLGTGGTDRFMIDGLGKIAINKTPPNYLLDVGGEANFDAQAIVGGTMTVAGNAFSVGGSTLVVAGGNVGIGVGSPWSRLTIESTIGNEIEIVSGGTNVQILATGSPAQFQIGGGTTFEAMIGATPRLLIDGTGRVGLTYASPQARLDVQAAAADTNVQIWRNSAGVIVSSMSSVGTYYGDGSGLSNVAAATGVDASKVAKAGDTMTGQLTLAGSSLTITGSGLTVGAALSNRILMDYTGGYGLVSVLGGALVLNNSGQNVGINTTLPSYTLDVNGVIRAQSQLIAAGTATVQGNAFSVGGSAFLVDGVKVGINNAAPLESLDIGSGNLRILPGQQLQWGSASSAISASGTGMTFYENAATRLHLGSTGGMGTAALGDLASVTIDTTSALHVVAKAVPGSDGRVAVFGDLRSNGISGGQYLAAGNFETTVQGTDSAELAAGVRAVIRHENAGAGLVNKAYGLMVDDLQNSAGTIGSTYGVYIGTQTAGTQVNTPYSLYAADQTARIYFGGRVGIGTESPQDTLHLVNSNPWIQIKDTGGSKAASIGMDVNKLRFDEAGVGNRMVLDLDTSRLGINTLSPNYTLDVQGGNVNASGGLCINDTCVTDWSSAGVWSRTGVVVSPANPSNNVLVQSTLTVAGNAFSVGGSTLVVTAGKVGIGVLNPIVALDVSGGISAGTISASNSVSATSIVKVNGGGMVAMEATAVNSNISASAAGAKNMIFTTDSVERMRIDNSGRVGIGTASPAYALHVTSGDASGWRPDVMIESTASGTPQLLLQAGGHQGRFATSGSNGGTYLGTASNDFLVFQTNGAERMRLAANGNFGISDFNPNPAYGLQIASGTGMSGIMLAVSTGPSGALVNVFTVAGNGDVRGGKFYGDGSGLVNVVMDGGTMARPLVINADTAVYPSNLITTGLVISTSGALQTAGMGNGAVTGNTRGMGAVDLQTARITAAQVASGLYAAITGGRENTASGNYSVASGNSNTASAFGASVGGGFVNTATANYSAVAGGINNSATAFAAAVGGGRENQASGESSFVGGGGRDGTGFGGANKAQGRFSAVAGGTFNVVSGSASVIAGGAYNNVTGTSSVVSGGENNRAVNLYSFVGGGRNNTAYDGGSAVSGGENNYSGAWASFIGGGSGNTTSNSYAAIVGGRGNATGPSADYAFLGGGYENDVNGVHAALGGGWYNVANGMEVFIGGGGYNTADGQYGAIAGGKENKIRAEAYAGFIGGGEKNISTAPYSVVGGGLLNTSSGTYSGVLAGYHNEAIGIAAAIGGGRDNTATGNDSVIGGGSGNTAFDPGTTVAGGIGNIANESYSFVGGGNQNNAATGYTAIAGGYQNTIGTAGGDGAYSFIGAGYSNETQTDYTVIGGGIDNYVANGGMYGTIGGGGGNTVSAQYASVVGGLKNSARGQYSFVGGGGPNATVTGNDAAGDFSAVVGGSSNTVTAQLGFVGGGDDNHVYGDRGVVVGGSRNIAGVPGLKFYSSVVGGQDNEAKGEGAFVGGGTSNEAFGNYAVVPGGSSNAAGGGNSFAAGYASTAAVGGAFAWNDSSGDSLVNNVVNQVQFRASGGFWVSTGTIHSTPGLFVSAGNWVGIGTDAPAKALHIKSQGVVPDIRLERGLGSIYWDIGGLSGVYFNIASGGTPHLTIADTGGQVGIGVTPTSSKLQVNGDLGLGDGTATGNAPIVIRLTAAAAFGDNSIVVASGGNQFSTTATPGDYRAIGVTVGATSGGAIGKVAVGGVAVVNCTAASAGQHAITSATVGVADATNTPASGASIGQFLTSCGTPSAGKAYLLLK